MLKFVNTQAVRATHGMRTTILEHLTIEEIWSMGLNLRIGFSCRSCGATAVRMQICSACKFAKYCCRGCQKRDWKRHKGICNPGFKNSKEQWPRPHDTYWGVVSAYIAHMIDHIAPMYRHDPISDIEFTDAVRIPGDLVPKPIKSIIDFTECSTSPHVTIGRCPTVKWDHPSCYVCNKWAQNRCYETECDARACTQHFRVCDDCGGGYCLYHIFDHSYCGEN